MRLCHSISAMSSRNTAALRSVRAFAVGILSILPIIVTPATALSVVAPRQTTNGSEIERPVIAIKLSPNSSSITTSRKRQDASAAAAGGGAALVESLVRSVLPSLRVTSGQKKRQQDSQLRVLPLFDLAPEVIDQVVKDAEANDPTYKASDFKAWYQVQIPEPDSAVNSILQKLANRSEVASCQRLGGVKPPQTAQKVQPNDDPEFAKQAYLKSSDRGINAEYAWGFPGGDGAGQRVIDIEAGWKLEHEDLVAKNITLLSGVNNRGRGFGDWRHGTSALGIMLMVDNKKGGVGAAPAARGDVVSVRRGDNPNDNNPAGILDATSRLKAGDVMLLEMQVSNMENNQYWPAELFDAEFEAIRAATAKGIVVIEPAGNGLRGTGEGTDDVNIDGPVTRPGETVAREWLNPKSSAYRGDSGAIIVGASRSTSPRTKTVWSNFGSRVDVHAWGENITTTSCVENGQICSDTYEQFAGTSGSSPIIAGAALSIQGMLTANGKAKLNSVQMRSMLKIKGTPTTDPQNGNIGVMPDLKALIDGGHLK